MFSVKCDVNRLKRKVVELALFVLVSWFCADNQDPGKVSDQNLQTEERALLRLSRSYQRTIQTLKHPMIIPSRLSWALKKLYRSQLVHWLDRTESCLGPDQRIWTGTSAAKLYGCSRFTLSARPKLVWSFG